MEDYQGGGMSGPIPIDFGQEAIQLEWTCGGFMEDVVRMYGITTHDGVQLRFSGGYQREDSKTYDSVEIVVRGRHKEIDMGSGKPKEDTDFQGHDGGQLLQAVHQRSGADRDGFHQHDREDQRNDLLAGLRQAIGL
ncbi:hypothetical protein B7759_03461 [Burkholderia glumae]|uniref:phage major tail tube protein n=1 Tax=Burkholderia glumae TaxID=337 RepID=UPI001BB6B4AF|nr:phage major tail tube protein [Burkholderia glumae]QTP34839.1 hypothetical protein B7759_03461 [Burkholderia glumae]